MNDFDDKIEAFLKGDLSKPLLEKVYNVVH